MNRLFTRWRPFAPALAALLFASCGIDEYLAIEQVPLANIKRISGDNNDGAYITLGDGNRDISNFEYLIFYRFYVSGTLSSGLIPLTEESLKKINLNLWADYSAICAQMGDGIPDALSTTKDEKPITMTFPGSMNYYQLGNSLPPPGGTIDIDFQQTNVHRQPSINGVEMHRYSFTVDIAIPKPEGERRFLNSDELNAADNVFPSSKTINLDTVDYTATLVSNTKDISSVDTTQAQPAGISGRRYTYVALFLVGRALNTQTVTYTYGAPTFINVLQLPEWMAETQSAKPTVDVDTVAKTATTQAAVEFTLTNVPELVGTWKVYSAASGESLAEGVRAAVTTWPTLRLSRENDLPARDYYLTITEAGKTESDRLKLTVSPP